MLPETTSDWTYIRAGVPRVSILGPLLFLLYIYDILVDIGSNVDMFADDTSLFIVVDNPETAANCLNSDLSRIWQWAKIWLESIDPAKQEPFSSLVNRINHNIRILSCKIPQ